MVRTIPRWRRTLAFWNKQRTKKTQNRQKEETLRQFNGYFEDDQRSYLSDYVENGAQWSLKMDSIKSDHVVDDDRYKAYYEKAIDRYDYIITDK